MCTMEVHVEEVLSCSGSAVAPVAVVSELPRESFQMVSFGGIFHCRRTPCVTVFSGFRLRRRAFRRVSFLSFFGETNVKTFFFLRNRRFPVWRSGRRA